MTGHGTSLRLELPDDTRRPVSPGRAGQPPRRRQRQLGYKSVKFLNRLLVTDTLDDVPDQGSVNVKYGYAWYAGI